MRHDSRRSVVSAPDPPDAELHGTWDLPGTSQRLRGRLVASEGRQRLQLEGLLPVSSSEGHITIQGELLDGRSVSLLDCDLAVRRVGRPDMYTDEWHVGRALLGLLVADAHECVFAGVRLELHGLAEAVGLSGLSVTSSDLTSPQNKRVAVEWEEPAPIAAAFALGTLTLRCHPRFEAMSDFEFGLTNRAVAQLTADAPISLDDVDRFADDLLSLVALATEAAGGVTKLTLQPTGRDLDIVVSTTGRPWYGPNPAAQEPRLTLAQLGSEAQGVIEAFQRFRREQPEAAELLFEYQVFAAVMTPPDRFLYLARFLEAYHRRDAGIASKVNFVDRVTALLEGSGKAAHRAFGAPARQLAETIRDTRNYYVHYDPKHRAKARHGVPLDDLADRVWCAVRSVLLSDLGLPDLTIENILETDWRFQRASEAPL